MSAARFYLSIVRRRWIATVLCVVLPIALALAYSFVQKPLYQGTAQVLLSRQSLASIVTGQPDPTGQVNDFIRIVQTQADLARTPELAAQVIEQSGTSSLSPKELLASSSVEPSREADLLTFHVTSRTQAGARNLTTGYAQGFTEYRRALDTASLRRARSLLSRRIIELENETSRNQRLISSLSDKEQQLRTLETLQTSNVTLVRRADRAEQVAPTTSRNLILGLLAGLALAVIAVSALESLDNRVRSPREIEERLGGTPLLSRVPPPPPGLKGQLVMLAQPNSPDAEAFRLLRTTMRFATVDRPIHSLMVTSAIQGEGKSTTLANLAVTLARAGQRVVLIDLDLRRPTVRRLFQFPPGLGLVDVIQGSARLADALHEIPVASRSSTEQSRETEQGPGSLKILAAGTPPHDPGEIVASPAIATLIGHAQEDADVVLVDAPPVLQVGDALALSAHVDALFVCVRPQSVTRSMLDELRRVLGGAPAELLGAVVVGELPKAMDNYGGYGYGYGYRNNGYGQPPDGPATTSEETERDLSSAERV